jgi:hypothetical protein
MDPLVVDAKAEVRVRDLGGHLRQPGQQERRDIAEPFPKDGRLPEPDHLRGAFLLRLLGEEVRIVPPLPHDADPTFQPRHGVPRIGEYVTSIRESPVFLTYWAVIG